MPGVREGFTGGIAWQPKEDQLEKIKIFGHQFDVDYRELRGKDLLGESSNAQNRIVIDPWQAPSQQEDTFLHEIVHQISNVLGLKLDEETVWRLAAGLHTIIVDNPQVFSLRLPVRGSDIDGLKANGGTTNG